tara:strand:- start:890 stop:1372 length:483 start_codon:yes stop_codon:yes gene_type:complete
MSKAEKGRMVSVHYKGTFDDGTEFDNSYNRDEPIKFVVGSQQMIAGFDAAVTGMTIGEKKSVRITSDQAYGEVNPGAFTEVPRESFPSDFPLEEGVTVQGTDPEGRPLIGTINKVEDTNVLLNLNHPMAGKDLNFEIELVNVNENEDVTDTTDTTDTEND